jgi:hypothetical protein
MNETELISKLAASAGSHSGFEATDLTDRVLSTIRQTRRESSSQIWLTTAAATCIIAIVVSIGAAQTWSSFANPLTDLSVSHTPTVIP